MRAWLAYILGRKAEPKREVKEKKLDKKNAPIWGIEHVARICVTVNGMLVAVA